MSSILVTGGAGYVGSHIVRRLREEGRDVVALDDLSEGHREAVGDDRLVVGDFGDRALLNELLSGGKIHYVIHMAASCLVGESVEEPAKYYRNNVGRSLDLLDALRDHGVRGLVFSSSAAVYGEPDEIPITEEHTQSPTNPYGETKLALERALRWYHGAYGLRYAALRYFNAAGAQPGGDIGEDHPVETHLIPNLLRAARDGAPAATIYGTDYPTPDGTCVRDYVHVVDLADAHVRAIDAMESGDVLGEAFNLGNGAGFSVRQVVDVVEAVTGRPLPVREGPRRPGDPAVLVASSERARDRLGWSPRLAGLEDIVGTAWEWHRTHPEGYRSSRRGGRG